MFSIDFYLPESSFPAGPLGHLDFDKVLLTARHAQQKFLSSLGLDIWQLTKNFPGLHFHLIRILDTRFGVPLFTGDTVSATVELQCEKDFRLNFKIVVSKAGKLACDAYFEMVLVKDGTRPIRLISEIKAILSSHLNPSTAT